MKKSKLTKVLCFFLSRKKVFLAFFLVCGSAHALSDPSELLKNTQEEARAELIGSQLRCLVCQNESIEESNAGLARDLRKIVREQVVAGRTNQQIIAWMVARYGSFVRLKPPFNAATFLLWATPVLALLVGGTAAFLGYRRKPAPPAPLSEAEKSRLAELSNLA